MESLVTPIYVALIAILMAVLSSQTAMARRRNRIALGDEGNAELVLASRRFGNLIEYAPIMLLLLFFMELQGIASVWLHLYGAVFVLLRIIHAISLFGTLKVPEWKRIGRTISAGGTMLMLLIGAAVNLIAALG
ncbi:MAPEG family protein [Sneathiella limimaris]|uniref:MAPEG family protein n=1 Tax=Sneathiella limimaris TaxID=1964213 RepID=UPI00146B268E|nr:MAPEG family protein [Sneathiella limimaris]